MGTEGGEYLVVAAYLLIEVMFGITAVPYPESFIRCPVKRSDCCQEQILVYLFLYVKRLIKDIPQNPCHQVFGKLESNRRCLVGEDRMPVTVRTPLTIQIIHYHFKAPLFGACAKKALIRSTIPSSCFFSRFFSFFSGCFPPGGSSFFIVS